MEIRHDLESVSVVSADVEPVAAVAMTPQSQLCGEEPRWQTRVVLVVVLTDPGSSHPDDCRQLLSCVRGH